MTPSFAASDESSLLKDVRQVEEAQFKQIGLDEAAWTASAQQSLKQRVIQLNAQESAFESAEAVKDQQLADAVQNQIQDLSAQVVSLQSKLTESLEHLQTLLNGFRAAELSSQQQFQARVQRLSAQIASFSTSSDTELESIQASLANLDKGEQNWNISAVQAGIADQLDLAHSLAIAVQDASTNVSTALHSSVAALRTEAVGWFQSSTVSANQLVQRAEAWDQAQKAALNEIQGNLNSFDQERSALLSGLSEAAREFNESLIHQSSVFDHDLDSGHNEGKELESNLQNRIVEDSKAGVEEVERDLHQLRSEWASALKDIESHDSKLIHDDNQTLQQLIQEKNALFLENEKRISANLESFDSKEEQLKSSFQNRLQDIALHSSITARVFEKDANNSRGETDGAAQYVSSSLQKLSSHQTKTISALKKLVGLTLFYLRGNVSRIIDLNGDYISNRSLSDEDIRHQHLMLIEDREQDALRALENQISTYESDEKEKNRNLDGSVNFLQNSQKSQESSVESNFAQLNSDTDNIINASAQVIARVQLEMAKTFMKLERSIFTNLSDALISINSSVHADSNAISNSIKARAALERTNLHRINETLFRQLKSLLDRLTDQRQANVASIANQGKALQDLLTLTTATSEELERRISAVSNLTTVSFTARREALNALAKDMSFQNFLLSKTIDSQTRAAGRAISKDFQNKTLSESTYLASRGNATLKWLLDEQSAVSKDLISLKNEIHTLTVHAGDDRIDRNLELQIDSLDQRESSYFSVAGISIQDLSAGFSNLAQKREVNKTRIQNRLIALKKLIRDSFSTIDANISALKAKSSFSTSLQSLNMTAPFLDLKRRLQIMLNYVFQVSSLRQ